jgi:polar amino acid transport system substrate-binding protein
MVLQSNPVPPFMALLWHEACVGLNDRHPAQKGNGAMRVSTTFLATIGLIGSLAISGAALAQKKSEYNVALDGTFAPHAMPNLSGGVEGFNVDLTNEIGKRLGVKMNITAAQWSGLLPAMQAGKYDFIVAPTTITEERAQNMLFTEGYYNTDFLFAVKSGTPEITALEGFKGKIISVNKGAIYDRWARGLESEYGWKVQSYGTQTDAIQAVIAGRAFANVAGNTAVAWAVKKNPQLDASFNYSTGQVFGMPFRKDDVETRNMVEAVIECMKTDGTMAAMSEKWFGITPAPDSAALTVQPGYGQPGIEGYDPTPHELQCN